MFNRFDIIGNKFGKLTVDKFISKTEGKYFYMCTCECGNKKKLQRSNLLNHTKSCGCLKKISRKNNKGWTGFEDISGGWWTSIKNKAIYRKLDFTVTIEDGWKLFQKQKGLCALTGIPLTLVGSKYTYNKPIKSIGKSILVYKTSKIKKCFKEIYRTASLDRINNKKGYVKGNIQWVHKDINWMKGTFSQKEFIELCKLVTIKNNKL
jgi:hypothetical protein